MLMLFIDQFKVGTDRTPYHNISPTLPVPRSLPSINSKMLHSHCPHHLFFTNLPLPLSLTHHHYLSHLSPSLLLHKPSTLHTVSAIPPPPTSPWLTHLAQLTTVTEQGPIQLPFSTSILATTDDPSTIQAASTVLLTGAITASLFRSLRRRAKRAKELKFRSSGAKKSLDRLKGVGSSSIKAKSPPSPDQALLGAVIAGIIAVILYKFTISIEATLSRQTVSDNFSVRQITITIRTIINGLCYLATFVYGINSLGLLLYSGELALNTFVGGPDGKGITRSKITEQSGVSNSSVETLTSNNKLGSTKEDQNSKNSQ